MVHVCCMYVASMLHVCCVCVRCMCAARILRACCICDARVLQVCCMPAASCFRLLQVYCIYVASMSRACCVYAACMCVACMLHVCCEVRYIAAVCDAVWHTSLPARTYMCACILACTYMNARMHAYERNYPQERMHATRRHSVRVNKRQFGHGMAGCVRSVPVLRPPIFVWSRGLCMGLWIGFVPVIPQFARQYSRSFRPAPACDRPTG